MTSSKRAIDRIETQAISPVRPLLVSIPEAAEMLRVCRTSIYELIWKDELTAVRIGRSVRLAVEQLEQFVSDRVAQSLRI
jgi:excisionase family DNA binding protein